MEQQTTTKPTFPDTANEWTAWLLRGFENWLDEDNRIFAFNPPGLGNPTGSAVPSIVRVYNDIVQDAAKTRFCDGLYNAIVSVDKDHIPSMYVLEDLVSVAARIEFSGSAIAIWNCIRNNREKLASNDGLHFGTSVRLHRAIASFARYKDGHAIAEEALRHPKTPPDLLPLLVLHLSKSRILSMGNYLALLKRRFEEREVKTFIRSNLRSFVQKIGVSEVVRSIQHLNLSREPTSDYWVAAELLLRNDSPLGCIFLDANEDEGLDGSYKLFLPGSDDFAIVDATSFFARNLGNKQKRKKRNKHAYAPFLSFLELMGDAAHASVIFDRADPNKGDPDNAVATVNQTNVMPGYAKVAQDLFDQHKQRAV